MGKSLIIKGAEFKESIQFNGYYEKKNGLDISKVYKNKWDTTGGVLRKIYSVRIPDVPTITAIGFVVHNITDTNKTVYAVSRTIQDISTITSREIFDSKLNYIKQFTLVPGRNTLFFDTPLTINQEEIKLGLVFESLKDESNHNTCFTFDGINTGNYEEFFYNTDTNMVKNNSYERMASNFDILLN